MTVTIDEIEYNRYKCEGCKLGPCFCLLDKNLEPKICLLIDLEETDTWHQLVEQDDHSYWSLM